MCMCEQWWHHCTSQWGWYILLSTIHVYCVAVAFKLIERVEQQICNKFCIKLEHSPTETIGWFRRPNLWELVIGSFILTMHPLMHRISCRVFLAKYQITQVTQSPYSPDMVPCDFWLFSKLTSPLKGKRFQTIDEIQENTTGQLMVIGRTVWDSKVPTLKGMRYHCLMYSISHILYLPP